MTPFETVAVAAAVFDGEPPVNTIVGADVYPDPGLVIVMAVTFLPLTVAVAAAPDPPPPLKLTVGVDV
jgi:hypothetical protein